MPRRELGDDQWKRIQAWLPGKASDPGRTATDNRKFVDAVLWIARTGAHWRELPESFGPWTGYFSDITGGQRPGYGSVCSVHSRGTQISNT
jgi:transposase